MFIFFSIIFPYYYYLWSSFTILDRCYRHLATYALKLCIWKNCFVVNLYSYTNMYTEYVLVLVAIAWTNSDRWHFGYLTLVFPNKSNVIQCLPTTAFFIPRHCTWRLCITAQIYMCYISDSASKIKKKFHRIVFQ